MRLLIITDDFPPVIGGIQTYSYEMAKNLAYLSEDILVLAPKDEGWEEFDKKERFKIIRVGLHANNYVKIFTMLFDIAYHSLKFKPDIIITTAWFPCGIPAYIISRFSGIPYVVPAYALELLVPPEGSILQRVMLKVLSGSSRVLPMSRYTCSILQELGIDEQLVSIIPGGVNPSDFSSAKDSKDIIKKYNLEDKKVILTVATLIYPYKGHDRVIRAMPKVLERIPNAVYMIVGEGPLQPMLEVLIRDLGLEEHVIFAGFVAGEELPSYYHACDIFIMPSSEDRSKGYVEGFGIVYLEANACCKPVIAGRCGGALDAVVDGKTGLLVDPLSIEEIAKALIKLLSDEEYAKKLGENGRERVRKEFDWKIIAEKQRGIIYSILGKTLQ
jgi:phosphatidylinositol alpha-1,6-mannosyltransferase